MVTGVQFSVALLIPIHKLIFGFLFFHGAIVYLTNIRVSISPVRWLGHHAFNVVTGVPRLSRVRRTRGREFSVALLIPIHKLIFGFLFFHGAIVYLTNIRVSISPVRWLGHHAFNVVTGVPRLSRVRRTRGREFSVALLIPIHKLIFGFLFFHGAIVYLTNIRVSISPVRWLGYHAFNNSILISDSLTVFRNVMGFYCDLFVEINVKRTYNFRE